MKKHTSIDRRAIIAGLILAAACAEPAMAAKGDWQQRMLFEPSEQQEKGRVMIYDGLRDVKSGGNASLAGVCR